MNNLLLSLSKANPCMVALFKPYDSRVKLLAQLLLYL